MHFGWVKRAVREPPLHAQTVLSDRGMGVSPMGKTNSGQHARVQQLKLLLIKWGDPCVIGRVPGSGDKMRRSAPAELLR
ncbi:MAG: hypothetical protein COA73_17115 [Candidatus Hydrogenedentota bacterium]|nr:MAG: hypothetical protein COA73_17115 [Candidatus Hydrogenedentota bacterium]